MSHPEAEADSPSSTEVCGIDVRINYRLPELSLQSKMPFWVVMSELGIERESGFFTPNVAS